MAKNRSLGLQFILLLGVIFLSGMALSGVLLHRTAEQKAEWQVAEQAITLMEVMNSVRNYTSGEISPLLSDRIETESTFTPQIIPAYSATQVFQDLQQRAEPIQKQYANLGAMANYATYRYKEATLDPTNSRDQADAFESDLVAWFRKDPELQVESGFRTIAGKKLYYIARPLAITKESCLRCHSTPDKAPKSQIQTYGSKGGFGWKLNQIIAAQTVYVAADEVFQSYQSQLWNMLQAFGITFAVAMIVLYLFLKRMVIQPIAPMARLAERISNDELVPDEAEQSDLRQLDHLSRRTDELGQLAGLFRRMTHVVSDREQSLKQLVHRLRDESETAKKAVAIATQTAGMNTSLQDLLDHAKRTRLIAESQSLNLVDQLRNVPYFQDFTEDDLQALSQTGHKQTFIQNEVICRQDDPGDSFYIILVGSVEVVAEHLNQRIRTLSTGSFFGELALLLGIPRTATIRTLASTIVFVLNREGLQTLLTEHQEWADQIAEKINEHQSELSQRRELLRQHGLLGDEETFNRNPLGWIRQRMTTLFGV